MLVCVSVRTLFNKLILKKKKKTLFFFLDTLKMPTFSRNPELETKALEAGWDVAQIKRTRIIDLEKRFNNVSQKNQKGLDKIDEESANENSSSEEPKISFANPLTSPNIDLPQVEHLSTNNAVTKDRTLQPIIKDQPLRSQGILMTQTSFGAHEALDMGIVSRGLNGVLNVHSFFDHLCKKYKEHLYLLRKKVSVLEDLKDIVDKDDFFTLQKTLAKDRDKLSNVFFEMQNLRTQVFETVEKRKIALNTLAQTFSDQKITLQNLRGKNYKFELILQAIDLKMREWKKEIELKLI
eukprot:COSAG01_NODE_330_length_18723_cov_96.763155_4_plen_294_part_00